MAAVSQLSASLSLSIRDACGVTPAAKHVFSRLPTSRFGQIKTTFATGTPLLTSRTCHTAKCARKAALVSIRCERRTRGNSLDVWLGRLAMVGFAVAISVEIATGKGLLENFGLATPLPTVALAVTGLVGVLTAVFIFQSAAKS